MCGGGGDGNKQKNRKLNGLHGKQRNVRPTVQTIASTNKTLEESKKAEKSAVSSQAITFRGSRDRIGDTSSIDRR